MEYTFQFSIPESFLLEGVSGDGLVQHTWSKHGHLEQVTQGHVQSDFEYL